MNKIRTLNAYGAFLVVSVFALIGAATAHAAPNGNAWGYWRNQANTSNTMSVPGFWWGGQRFNNVDDFTSYMRQNRTNARDRVSNQYRYPNYYRAAYQDVDVTTETTVNIYDGRATLRGSYDLNDAPYADVWFEYGRDSDNLSVSTQPLRVYTRTNGTFQAAISGLADGQRYYVRAVIEDPNGTEEYGNLLSFVAETSGYYPYGSQYPYTYPCGTVNGYPCANNYNGNTYNYPYTYPNTGGYPYAAGPYYGGYGALPLPTTDGVRNVDSRSAEVSGEVDMRGYRSGVVFFVYGEDRNEVADVAHDYDTYADINEHGYDLQKVRADSDLDGRAQYSVELDGLHRNTRYYYAIGVEYGDGSYRNDRLIVDGVRSFTTDR